jgi:hypothetical protein
MPKHETDYAAPTHGPKYGAPENSAEALDPHGERSLGVSPVRMQRATGEVGAEMAMGPEE